MTKILIEAILQVLVLIPFAIFFLKEKSKLNFGRIFIFGFCYIVYQIFLVLPKLNSTFDFIKSSWNWDGKIYGLWFYGGDDAQRDASGKRSLVFFGEYQLLLRRTVFRRVSHKADRKSGGTYI